MTSQPAQSLVDKAMALTQEGKPDEALPLLDEALAADAAYWPGWLHRGYARAHATRFEEAVSDWEKALELEPKLPMKLQTSAQAAAHRKLTESSLEQFRWELTLAPENARLNLLYGRAQRVFGRLSQALESLGQVSPHDPAHLDALELAARILRQLGQNEQALKTWQKVLQSRPDSVEVNYELGSLAHKSNALALALRHLEKVVTLKSEHLPALLALGEIYLKQGRHDLAEDRLQKVLRLQPDNPSALAGLAGCRQEQYLFDEALGYYKRAVEADPKNPELHFRLGFLALQLGNLEAAVSALEKGLELRPNDAEVLFSLAKAYEQKNDLQRASEYYTDTLRVNSRADHAAYNLGLVFEAMGKLEEAMNAFRRASEIKPNEPHYLERLAAVASRAEDHDTASDASRAAVRSAPDSADSRLNLARVLQRQGRQEEAMEAFRQALALNAKFSAEIEKDAQAAFERGADEQAMDFYRMLAETEGWQAWAWEGIGRVMARQEKTLLAMDFLYKAVVAEPSRLSALRELGAICLANQEPARLLEAIREVLVRQPAYAEVEGFVGVLLELWSGADLPSLALLLADSLHSQLGGDAGARDEAARIYLEHARKLESQGDIDRARVTLGRLLELEPAQSDALELMSQWAESAEEPERAPEGSVAEAVAEGPVGEPAFGFEPVAEGPVVDPVSEQAFGFEPAAEGPVVEPVSEQAFGFEPVAEGPVVEPASEQAFGIEAVAEGPVVEPASEQAFGFEAVAEGPVGEPASEQAFGFEPAEAFAFEPSPMEEALQSPTGSPFEAFDTVIVPPAQEARTEQEAFGFEPAPARPGPSVADSQDFEPIPLDRTTAEWEAEQPAAPSDAPEVPGPEVDSSRLTASQFEGFEMAVVEAEPETRPDASADRAEAFAISEPTTAEDLSEAAATESVELAEALEPEPATEAEAVELPVAQVEAEAPRPVAETETEADTTEEAPTTELAPPDAQEPAEPAHEPLETERGEESASPEDALEDEEGDAMIASEPRIDERWGPLVGAVLKSGGAQELLLSLPRPQDTRESLEKMSQLARRLELAGRPQEAALVALRRIEIEDGPQARHELMRILQLWGQSLTEVDLIEEVSLRSGLRKPARLDDDDEPERAVEPVKAPEPAPRTGPPASPMPRGPIKPPSRFEVKPPTARAEVKPASSEEQPEKSTEDERAPVETSTEVAEKPTEDEKAPAEEVKTPVVEAKPARPALSEVTRQTEDGGDLDELREQLFQHPTDAELRARALALLGQDPSGLVRFYREISARLPESAPHLLNVARAYVHSQQDQLAVLNFQKALKLEGTAEGYHELSLVYVRLGKNELASKTAEKARELEAGG